MDFIFRWDIFCHLVIGAPVRSMSTKPFATTAIHQRSVLWRVFIFECKRTEHSTNNYKQLRSNVAECREFNFDAAFLRLSRMLPGDDFSLTQHSTRGCRHCFVGRKWTHFNLISHWSLPFTRLMGNRQWWPSDSEPNSVFFFSPTALSLYLRSVYDGQHGVRARDAETDGDDDVLCVIFIQRKLLNTLLLRAGDRYYFVRDTFICILPVSGARSAKHFYFCVSSVNLVAMAERGERWSVLHSDCLGANDNNTISN